MYTCTCTCMPNLTQQRHVASSYSVLIHHPTCSAKCSHLLLYMYSYTCTCTCTVVMEALDVPYIPLVQYVDYNNTVLYSVFQLMFIFLSYMYMYAECGY